MMNWNKPSLPVKPEPQPPSLLKWLGALMLLMLSVISIFNLTSIFQPGLFESLHLLFAACLVVGSGLLALFFRYLTYSFKHNGWQAWEQERLTIEDAWEKWSKRYVALFASYVFIPGNITANTIAKAEASIETKNGLVQKIDYFPSEDGEKITLLLKSINIPLSQLPPNTTIHIKLLNDFLPSRRTAFMKVLAEIWQSQFPLHPITTLTELSESYADKLQSIQQSKDESINVIMIMQQDDRERYSDAMGVFILASDDVAENVNLSTAAGILRPLFTSPQKLETDLLTFFTTQKAAKAASGCYCAQQQGLRHSAVLMQQSHAANGALQINQIRDVERFAGLAGPAAPWLALGLAADTSSITQTACLMLAEHQNGWLIHAVQSMES